MSRIAAIGLTALILTACGSADQTRPTEPVTPAATASAQLAEPVSPAGATRAPQPSAPVTWEAMQDHYRQLEVVPADPLEALEMRAVLCSHFSGEIGSEDPERERYLNAQMDKYRCGDELVAEARAMRNARSGEPAVVARLDTILAALA